MLSVQWTGVYSPAETPLPTDSFTIVFYADNAGLPGAAAGTFPVGNSVGRVDSTVDLNLGGGIIFDIYNYTATVNQPVTMGTTYWLSIFNDTTADADDSWFWGTGTTGTAARSNNQASWMLLPGSIPDMDFVLEGTVVPEPGTASLLLLGGGLPPSAWHDQPTIQPGRSFVPDRTRFLSPRNPSDESLGYCLSPFRACDAASAMNQSLKIATQIRQAARGRVIRFNLTYS